jgi:hypothetical protein
MEIDDDGLLSDEELKEEEAKEISSIKSDHLTNEQMLDLNEIQLSDKSDGEKISDDASEIAKNYIEVIINGVFDMVREKDKIESKRKTWNKIRKVEKV